MKKWLPGAAIAFFGLVSLLFTAAFFLLGTESGTQFLIVQAEKLLDENLQIGTARGRILDRLELADIRFSSSTGVAQIRHLVLDWKSTDLFRLHLHILEILADDVSYEATPQNSQVNQRESGPGTLPEIALPIRLSIEKLALNNFTFLSAPDTEALSIDKAALKLAWDEDTIQIETLNVTTDMASIQIRGKIHPNANYPLQLTTDVTTLSQAIPTITIKGSLSGDLEELQIVEEISGDISANLDITVKEILSDPGWHGKLTIAELIPAAFAPDIPGRVTGKLTTSGTLKQTELASTLSIRDKTAAEVNWDADINVQVNLESLTLDIKQFTLKQPENEAILDITGIADIGQNFFDLLLHWQELQWPVHGAADYGSPKGEATLKGTIDSYHIVLDGLLTGNDLPASTVNLNAQGSADNLKNLQLTLGLLGGEVVLQGDVAWGPDIKWNLKIKGTQINPGIYYPDWPGRLNWLIGSNGFIEEDGVSSNIIIDSLNGRLRELPITGTGGITVKPNDIRIEDLNLASGSATITASGNLGEQSNLQWKADIADFSDLLPDSSGQIKASGTIRKSMTEPQIDIALSGNSITYTDLTLDTIQADVDLDLSWTNPFSFTFNAGGLKSGYSLINAFYLQGKGNREEHTVQIKADHDMADISLTLSGGYSDDKWRGLLDTFSILSTELGNWQMQEPTTISASVTAASLAPLCLRRDNSDLCIEGMWNSENKDTSGNLRINKIPLNWLSPWFPETLESLTGLFSAQATVTMKDKLKVDATAAITPGEISYQTEKAEGTLPHEGLALKLKIVDDALETDFHISANSNILSGHIQSPNLLQKDIGGKAKLQGTLLVNAKHFELVEALVPDVKGLSGAIDLNFTILGTVEEPDIDGNGQLSISHVLIPVIGLDLTDSSFDLTADNKEITLKGSLQSPEGSMQLEGNATLDSEKGWPARLTLKGNNFRLVNLPDITILLSSDILFEKNNGLVSLTGVASIPKADILLRELPPGSLSASPDVVILQEQQKENEVKSPFRMLLKISLEDRVHFVGLGFNTYINGQITILSEPDEQMIGSGAFYIEQGSFRAYGQDLDIETGVISFAGGPLSQPGINLRATRTVGDVVAGIYAIGPLKKPRLTTFSNPPMSESHVISYLLTGSSPETSTGTRLSIGRQINSKLSVSVGTDVKTGESEFITRYRLNRNIHLQTTTGTSSNAGDIFYTIELEDAAVVPTRLW
ncbi:hypothetical protein UWK_02197 [Desulfocapsa sulfexigens DSM 10523]|uniref:Translocation and assembly module TamB C-terminal domain-containing protein n=1 Tax=Desulfocapsa sulfexigens (strain DSM 10523 / SB164P1) TaxID=1167006 RepID=M1P5G8_DESSD|nr:translocation/assembly module TamB domain-containing protein [Desulfocapsa sulfexigens]AGF78738.1 hypothetical protein UWK_02197 [Desulfocapsa sulfexigens DSM 10523]